LPPLTDLTEVSPSERRFLLGYLPRFVVFVTFPGLPVEVEIESAARIAVG
jgi:hypothetical protein